MRVCKWSTGSASLPYIGENEEGRSGDGHLQPSPVPDEDGEHPCHGLSQGEGNLNDDAHEGAPLDTDELNG